MTRKGAVRVVGDRNRNWLHDPRHRARIDRLAGDRRADDAAGSGGQGL